MYYILFNIITSLTPLCVKYTVCSPILQNNFRPEDVTRRSVISVLKSSLDVKSGQIDFTNEARKVRYKLVIDSSEDESVTRLLYAFNIVDPATTRTYMCSSFPEDGEVQEVHEADYVAC